MRGGCTSRMRLHTRSAVARGVFVRSNRGKNAPSFIFENLCTIFPLGDETQTVVISNLSAPRAQSPLKLHVVLNSVAVETEKFCSDSVDMLTKSGMNIIPYLKWIWYAKYSSLGSQIGLGAFGEEKVINTRWVQSCISKPATVFREQKCRKRK